MDARRGDAEDGVPCPDVGLAREHGVFFRYAHREPREIEVIGAVEIGHLRRLPAAQAAAGQLAPAHDAPHDVVHARLVDPAAGDVVEEHDGPRAADQEVVDIHGHEVDADGVVASPACAPRGASCRCRRWSS